MIIDELHAGLARARRAQAAVDALGAGVACDRQAVLQRTRVVEIAARDMLAAVEGLSQSAAPIEAVVAKILADPAARLSSALEGDAR